MSHPEEAMHRSPSVLPLTAGEAAILSRMQQARWQNHGTYLAAPINEESVTGYHDFFSRVAQKLGLETLEDDSSRIALVTTEDGKTKHEIRLTLEEAQLMGISLEKTYAAPARF